MFTENTHIDPPPPPAFIYPRPGIFPGIDGSEMLRKEKGKEEDEKDQTQIPILKSLDSETLGSWFTTNSSILLSTSLDSIEKQKSPRE